jgi:hypothetical protein
LRHKLSSKLFLFVTVTSQTANSGTTHSCFFLWLPSKVVNLRNDWGEISKKMTQNALLFTVFLALSPCFNASLCVFKWCRMMRYFYTRFVFCFSIIHHKLCRYEIWKQQFKKSLGNLMWQCLWVNFLFQPKKTQRHFYHLT